MMMMMMIHYKKIIQFTFFQSESAHAPIDPRPMVCVQRFPRGRGTEFECFYDWLEDLERIHISWSRNKLLPA